MVGRAYPKGLRTPTPFTGTKITEVGVRETPLEKKRFVKDAYISCIINILPIEGLCGRVIFKDTSLSENSTDSALSKKLEVQDFTTVLK